MKTQKILKSTLLIATLLALSACASNPINSTAEPIKAGTVIRVKTVHLDPERIRPNGNLGVSLGSGGYRGIYGGIDFATLGRIINNANKPKIIQQIVVRKTDGETVAITQDAKENFARGDKVRLMLVNGKARVIH